MVVRFTNGIRPVMASTTRLALDTGNRVIKAFRPGKGTGVVTHAAIIFNYRMAG